MKPFALPLRKSVVRMCGFTLLASLPCPPLFGAGVTVRFSLNFSQVFKFVRTKYVHNIHRRRYVITSFTLDPLHSEISWVRGLFSELPRFFGDRSDLFAPQRQSSCTLTRSREPTL